MGCKEFSLIPLKKDYLVLRSIFTLVKQQQVDPLTKLREARLRPYIIDMVSKTYNSVNLILKSIRRNWFNKMIDSDIPISYFVLTCDKQY
jgi:hypothetical protein